MTDRQGETLDSVIVLDEEERNYLRAAVEENGTVCVSVGRNGPVVIEGSPQAIRITPLKAHLLGELLMEMAGLGERSGNPCAVQHVWRLERRASPIGADAFVHLNQCSNCPTSLFLGYYDAAGKRLDDSDMAAFMVDND